MREVILFLLKRIVLSIVTIFLVATATFFLMKTVPGDPFADEMQNSSATSLEAMRSYYGLDDTLMEQYWRYVNQIFHLDLGPSLKYPSQGVNQIITGGFPISATIGIEALLLAIPLGMLLGTIASLQKKYLGKLGMVSLTVFGVSVPSFVIATSLQFLFAIYFPLFPVARWGSFSHTILPALSLAIGPSCFIARLLRAQLLEVLSQPYVQTARLKGLTNTRIMVVHVWKNACIPILAYLGPVTTNVLVGSFVVERVFGIPGLGQWFVNGVINRDYPVIGGLTIFYSMLLLFIHTVIDLINGFLLPQTKKERV